MGEFKEKDDEVSQEKHEGDEHPIEKEVKNCPAYNIDFQSHDTKPETLFIQEKDFKSDPENYSARTEPPTRTKQMSNPEVDGGSHHRSTLQCSKEFSGKDNCNAPCLAIVSSTSRPAKDVLSIDVTGRNKNGKVESHYINCGGKLSSSHWGASKMEKGKEPIIYEADDGRSSSNRREDGRENIECISSRGVVSTAKRARIYDSELEKLVGGKRLKRLNNCNSSFMNWVTTITNGLTKPHDGPVEAFQLPSQRTKGILSPPMSAGKREDICVSHGARGFRSVFQAVYNPGNNISSKKI